MSRALVRFRSCVFAVFIVCNAIVCCVAVWNLSIAQSRYGAYNAVQEVAEYLIFVGAFGLLCAIPIIFLDLFTVAAITSRIWFECLWLGLFWIFEIAGAAAVSSSVFSIMCTAHESKYVTSICASTKVLMAFTWICAVVLLVYLVTLIVSTIAHQSSDRQIWRACAKNYPWFATRSSLGSAPPSPGGVEKRLTLIMPRPRRPDAPIARSSWIPSEAQSNENQPNNNQSISTFSALPLPQAAKYGSTNEDYAMQPVTQPEAVQTPPSSYQRHRDLPPLTMTVPTLYPSSIHSAIGQSSRSTMRRLSMTLEPSPSPLGDWPRTGGVSEKRPKRRPPLPSDDKNLTTTTTTTTTAYGPTEENAAPVTAKPNYSKGPRGPRNGNESQRERSARRPPPLNLNGISNVSK